MSKKVTLDNLASAVKEIIDNYGDEVSTNVDKITKEVGKKGVQALKYESKEKFGTTKNRKRKYANTWTSRTEQTRLRTSVTIYNTQGWQPHLLENGHALVSGGRRLGTVNGRAHIKPVEDMLIREYEQDLEAKL